jgi:alpha-beta hydrolase superfamily lysophospholipase
VGGRQIFWQSWQARTPDGIVVIVHGASEHSDRYAHVARRLVDEGYAVYASDHQGHGRSEGPRALVRRMADAVSDLDQLVVLAQGEHPEVPLFMLGHSMGGTVALRYTLAHQDHLSGLILSGPLAALEAAPAPMRLAGRILSALVPTLPLVSIDASLVSRDPEVVRAYVADPLVHHGRLPARTVAELAAAIDAFPGDVGAIRIPTLILYGTADRLCPPAGSQMLSQRIGADDIEVKAYQGLYHEILNEPEREVVLSDICAWLSAHRPSVAGRDAAGSSTA